MMNKWGETTSQMFSKDQGENWALLPDSEMRCIVNREAGVTCHIPPGGLQLEVQAVSHRQ